MAEYLHWVALVILIVAPPVVASTEIGICSDMAGDVKCVSAPVDGELITAYVVVTGTDALSSVSFRANVPERLMWIDDIDVFSQTSGTSVLGTSISFGACLTPPVHVLTMRFVGTPYPEYSCAFMWIEDAAGMDCAAQPVPIASGITRIVHGRCEISGPSNPSPPDQAQGVPLDAVLEWTGEGADGCALGEILYYSLYFGTTQNPPLVSQQTAWPGMDPGDLEPGTEYYWRVFASQYGFNSRLGPLWSFRTSGPVATQPTTWGRIKALYR
jgi:hypothetical protein